jgi:hypothetical protein
MLGPLCILDYAEMRSVYSLLPKCPLSFQFSVFGNVPVSHALYEPVCLQEVVPT